MQSTATEFWNGLAGRVANAYRLGRSLGATDGYATYATEYGQDARQAVIKLVQEDDGVSQGQTRRWTATSKISHPNLIQLLDYGECEMDGVHLGYVVMEWAEDNLSSVLARRPLTVSETKEMLEPMLGVLGYLHERGLVHGAIKPSNILANGDKLELSSDRITPVGERQGGLADARYSPPEANDGIASSAGDVWSLGITLAQALTQTVPNPASQTSGSTVESEFAASSNLPEPFSDIVRHCLRRDPAIRWTVPQIVSRLRGPSPTPSPAKVTEPPRTLAIERTGRPKWLYPLLAGVVAMSAIFALLYPRKHTNSPDADTSKTVSMQKPLEEPKPSAEAGESQTKPAPPTAPQSESAAPRVSTEAPRTSALPAAGKPSPFGKSGKSAGGVAESTGWYVVTATYGKRKDAEKRVESMKRQWPKFNPEVYTTADGQHHLVILGANLSREAASTLQSRALASGLARDTYISNR